MDPEREVHQGVGWFLREAWKIEPLPVEEFLLKYKETAAKTDFPVCHGKDESGAESKI